MTRSMYLRSGEVENTTGIARRVADISVSAIKQMPVLGSKVPGCLSLGQGIPSLATPGFIREAVAEALVNDDAIGRYSLQPGMLELRQEIARHLERTKGITSVDPETEIVVTCGAMEGLAAGISTLVERGDEVILPSPNYSPHIEQILFAEGRPVFVPLVEEDNWRLDTEKIRAAITKNTKAILICSPMNPTGSVFTESELRAVAGIALEHGLYVIADETYDFLQFDGHNHFSLTAIPELVPNLVAVFSFSKMFCMTGWRVGYLYASKRIVDQIVKVHDAFAICAPTLSQYAALTGLREVNGHDGRGDQAIAEVVQTLTHRRESICTHLDRIPSLFTYNRPQGAYYVFPRIVPDLPSTELALRLLYEARVITTPGNGFGPTGEGHIRLSFGGDDNTIDESMNRIKHWAESNDIRSLRR